MLSSFLSLFLHNILYIGFALIGTLLLIYGIPAIVSSPVAGLISDRIGRKRLLLICLFGESFGFFFMAYSMEIKSLLFISIAVTFSLLFDLFTGPPNSAYVADITEGSERTKGYTLIRVWYNAGVALGVGSGGILVDIIGFSVVTALAGLCIGIAFIIVFLFLPPSPYDIQLHKEKELVNSENILTLTFRDQLDSIKQSIKIITKDITFLEVCIAFFLASLVGGQWGVTFQLFANTKLNLSYTIIGFGVATNAIIVVFGQMYMTNSALNRRHTSIGIAGILLYCIAFIGIAVSAEWIVFPLMVFFIATIISTFGENLMSIPQSTLPSNIAPTKGIGYYNGIFQTAMATGWLVSTFFGGIILEFVNNSLLIWFILISPAIPAVFILAHVSKKIPDRMNRA